MHRPELFFADGYNRFGKQYLYSSQNILVRKVDVATLTSGSSECFPYARIIPTHFTNFAYYVIAQRPSVSIRTPEVKEAMTSSYANVRLLASETLIQI